MLEWTIVGSLAAWRLTSLMIEEDGPFDILSRARDNLCNRFDTIDRLLGCFWCASVWSAALISLLICVLTRGNLIEWLIYTLSISCLAILVDELLPKPEGTWPGQAQKPY